MRQNSKHQSYKKTEQETGNCGCSATGGRACYPL